MALMSLEGPASVGASSQGRHRCTDVRPLPGRSPCWPPSPWPPRPGPAKALGVDKAGGIRAKLPGAAGAVPDRQPDPGAARAGKRPGGRDARGSASLAWLAGDAAHRPAQPPGLSRPLVAVKDYRAPTLAFGKARSPKATFTASAPPPVGIAQADRSGGSTEPNPISAGSTGTSMTCRRKRHRPGVSLSRAGGR